MKTENEFLKELQALEGFSGLIDVLLKNDIEANTVFGSGFKSLCALLFKQGLNKKQCMKVLNKHVYGFENQGFDLLEMKRLYLQTGTKKRDGK